MTCPPPRGWGWNPHRSPPDLAGSPLSAHGIFTPAVATDFPIPCDSEVTEFYDSKTSVDFQVTSSLIPFTPTMFHSTYINSNLDDSEK